MRVDHDVSLLIPEVWCRMQMEERDPQFLIDHKYLEKCQDLVHEGQTIRSSRLGYRITAKFARTFFGRVFNHPHVVFTEEMLRPELQDMDMFAEGMENICVTHQRVAQAYFDDGTIAEACPPLQALLHIMAHGDWNGHDLGAVEVRSMFTRAALLESEWYQARLSAKQHWDINLWKRNIESLQLVIDNPNGQDVVQRMGLTARLCEAEAELARISSDDYLASLRGTLGRQPV